MTYYLTPYIRPMSSLQFYPVLPTRVSFVPPDVSPLFFLITTTLFDLVERPFVPRPPRSHPITLSEKPSPCQYSLLEGLFLFPHLPPSPHPHFRWPSLREFFEAPIARPSSCRCTTVGRLNIPPLPSPLYTQVSLAENSYCTILGLQVTTVVSQSSVPGSVSSCADVLLVEEGNRCSRDLLHLEVLCPFGSGISHLEHKIEDCPFTVSVVYLEGRSVGHSVHPYRRAHQSQVGS